VANTDTINKFISVFTAAQTPVQKAQSLVDLFCPNSADAWGAPIPSVGITDHGPHFTGKQIPNTPILPRTINVLFNRLLTSFPNISLAPAAAPHPPPDFPPFLSSPNAYAPPTIAYQTNLITGPYHAKWFAPGDPNYSPPLSDIPANPSASVTIPACCIFTFNGGEQIVQLAVYMDRWKLFTAFQPGALAIAAALGHATKEAFRDFEKENKK
jgi:hypothetical protein